PKRNMAMPATMAMANAHGSALAKFGTLKSSPRPKPLIGSAWGNIGAGPNLIEKEETTPRTGPGMASNAVLWGGWFGIFWVTGQTREIHRNGGMEMIHTLSSPPNVAAASGGSMP